MKARARKSDPQSSHDAAADMNESGKANNHRNIILEFIKRHPEYHYSCREIGYATNLTNGQVHKRMKELEGNGALRMPDALRCPISERKVTHWQYGHGEPPPALKKAKPAGLECWACRDDDGARAVFVGEFKPTLADWNDSNEIFWYTKKCQRLDEFQHGYDIFDAIFPPSIKHGQCVQVILPVAIIVEGD